MTYTVSTLKELLDALNGASEVSEIALTHDISINELVEISTDVVSINLMDNTLYIHADSGFKVTKGLVNFENGVISATSNYPIAVEGSDASIGLSSNLSVVGTNSIAKVTKKGKLYNDGARIVSYGKDGAAIVVEGYTIASDNSQFIQNSGEISVSDQDAIAVLKRGQVLIAGGSIDANQGDVVSTLDSSVTLVAVTGGSFRGLLPEGSIKDGIKITKEANEFYLVGEEPYSSMSEDISTITEPEIKVQHQPTSEIISEFKPWSNALKKPTMVYASPSLKSPRGKILCSYTVYKEAIHDQSSGKDFLPIKYRIPGDGRMVTGYILT